MNRSAALVREVTPPAETLNVLFLLGRNLADFLVLSGLALPPEKRALLAATARACPVTRILGPGVEVPMELVWP